MDRGSVKGMFLNTVIVACVEPIADGYWEGKTGRGHMSSTGKNERRKAPKKTDKERQEER